MAEQNPQSDNTNPTNEGSADAGQSGTMSVKKWGIFGFIIAALLGVIYWFTVSDAYMDMPIFSSSEARMRNGVAVIVAGTIAEQVALQSGGKVTIALKAEKTLWPSAEIVGNASSDAVNASMDLLLTSSTYTASRPKPGGVLTGDVDKSDIDWDIQQKGDGPYTIDRSGWRDVKFTLALKEGVIEGEWSYRKQGDFFEYPWEVEGTYDAATHQVEVDIDVGASLFDMTLRGTIAPLDK